MIRLKSMDEYRALLKTVERKGRFSNLYVTGEHVCAAIDDGTAFYRKIPGGYQLFFDCGTHFQMVLYFIPVETFTLPETRVPIVANLVFSQTDDASLRERVEALLAGADMKLIKCAKEFYVATGQVGEETPYRCLIQRLEAQGYTFCDLTEKHIDEAYALLSSEFNIFDLDGYDRMPWKRILVEKLACCVLDRAGRVCGIYILPKAYSGGLYVVERSYRGRGIGKALAYYAFNSLKREKTAGCLWIEENNRTHIGIVLKFNGIPTNRRAHQFVFYGVNK